MQTVATDVIDNLEKFINDLKDFNINSNRIFHRRYVPVDEAILLEHHGILSPGKVMEIIKCQELENMIVLHTLIHYLEHIHPQIDQNDLWNAISEFQKKMYYDDAFMEQYKDEIEWGWYPMVAVMQEHVLLKYADRQDWEYILNESDQTLSPEFIMENFDNIPQIAKRLDAELFCEVYGNRDDLALFLAMKGMII